MDNYELIDKLYKYNELNKDELYRLLTSSTRRESKYLYKKALKTKKKHYGKKVYLRGLIEISSFCNKGCKYCGINRNNKKADRYRLSKDEILEACEEGDKLGFNTFVLQGGEDSYYTDDLLIELLGAIKEKYPEKAITLSLGEKTFDSYEKYFKAGADRYLLRHETCNENLFREIHIGSEFSDRKECLEDLKDIGYQVGAGFMVGIPGFSLEDLVDDILFLKKINPAMVGIGPFIPHNETIFRNDKAGNLNLTLNCLALTRLFLPKVLLPATTALNSIDDLGRELGLLAGCNVIMPNLSPRSVREKYNLYEGKVYSGNESAEELDHIRWELKSLDMEMDMSRGDNINWR